MASFSARQEDHFQKFLSKTDFPLKLGSEILYLFLAEKWSFVYFFFFVATLSDFGFLFKIVLIELRKMLIRNKLFDVQFGNCSTPAQRYPDPADLLDL